MKRKVILVDIEDMEKLTGEKGLVLFYTYAALMYRELNGEQCPIFIDELIENYDLDSLGPKEEIVRALDKLSCLGLIVWEKKYGVIFTNSVKK